MTENGYTTDFGGPEGFAVFMDRDVWAYAFNEMSEVWEWTLDSTIPITVYTNNPIFNTDPCSDIYDAKLGVYNFDRLIAVITSDFNSHADAFEYDPDLQTWTETSTDTTFGATNSFIDIVALFPFIGNSLLYLTETYQGSNLWTFPTNDA
jgi:hypothetical protein